jgi:hypothetical protein
MKIEVWEDDDSTTCIVEGTFEKNKHLFTGKPKLLRTIEGEDWDDCMVQHFKLMGWSPYKPF